MFLDEIDDTPLTLQAKLLRVLEDRRGVPAGRERLAQVDFRIVAATNRDLRELIAAARFGDDLYERLAIVQIELPPLRERPRTSPALAQHFIEPLLRARSAAAPRVRARRPAALDGAARPTPGPATSASCATSSTRRWCDKRAGDELLLLATCRAGCSAPRARRPPAAPGVVDRCGAGAARGSRRHEPARGASRRSSARPCELALRRAAATPPRRRGCSARSAAARRAIPAARCAR